MGEGGEEEGAKGDATGSRNEDAGNNNEEEEGGGALGEIRKGRSGRATELDLAEELRSGATAAGWAGDEEALAQWKKIPKGPAAIRSVSSFPDPAASPLAPSSSPPSPIMAPGHTQGPAPGCLDTTTNLGQIKAGVGLVLSSLDPQIAAFPGAQIPKPPGP